MPLRIDEDIAADALRFQKDLLSPLERYTRLLKSQPDMWTKYRANLDAATKTAGEARNILEQSSFTIAEVGNAHSRFARSAELNQDGLP